MNGAETNSSSAMSGLAGELLREPFAEMCGLADMTLEQASELFATAMDELDESQTASFEKAKAIFCTMLLEMEQAPGDWLILTLRDLEQGTRPELSVPAAPPISVPVMEFEPIAEPEYPAAVEADAPIQPPPMAASEEAPLDLPKLRSEEAQEHFWAAHQIATWALSPNAQAHHAILERITCQQLCFAVELETQTKLAVALSQFAQRRGEMHRMLFSEDGTMGPTNDLQTAIDTLAGMMKTSGKEANFDLGMMTYALRYLSLSSTTDLSRPSLMELGVFLVFFCGALEHTSWAHASIEIPGLEVEQRLELGLHLIRLQVLRNHSLNVHLPLSFMQSEEIRRRCETCFEMLLAIGNSFRALDRAS